MTGNCEKLMGCGHVFLPGLLLVVASAIGQESMPEDSLAHEIDAIVAPHLADGNFMGVIGIMRDDEPVLLRSYGHASIELGVPHDDDGIFMIGSVSKQFTAVAILLLEEDGLLSTSDRLGKHLPDFPYGEQLTIEQLLVHTSGIADTYSLPTFGRSLGMHGTFEDVVHELGEENLTQTPGAGFSYSNGGYVLLAAVIEAVSGQAYGNFLEQRVFGPLGMDDTDSGTQGAAIKRRVYGYQPYGAREHALQFPQSNAYANGPGSIWSTARDLLTWSAALHGGEVLSPRSYTKLTRDYGAEYGFGVSVFERLGRAVIGHDGRISGFASDLATYVEEDTTIVVLSNVESVARDAIRYQVAAAYFGEPVPVSRQLNFPQAKPDHGNFVGKYAFGPTFSVSVEDIDGRLMARANQGGYSELVYAGGNRWFSRMLYTEVCFGSNADAEVDRLIWGCSDGAPVGERIDSL